MKDNKKKIIYGITLVAVIVAFVSCAKVVESPEILDNIQNTLTPTPTPTPEPTPTPTPEVERPEEFIKDITTNNLVDFSNINTATDNEINDYLNNLLQIQTVYRHIDNGQIEVNSIINIDYKGTINGLSFNGSDIANYILDITNGKFIPGFAEQCVGHSVGETFDVTIIFGEDVEGTYMDVDGQEKPLAGATAIYSVKVNYLAGEKYTSYEDLNDSAVIDLTGGYYTTLASFKKSIESDLVKTKISNLERDMWNKIISSVEYVEGNKDIVETLINDKKIEIDNYYKDMAKFYSVDFKEFITVNCGFGTEVAYKEFVNNDAERKIREEFLVNYIIKKNNLDVGDEAYNTLGLQLAKDYGFNSLEDFEKEYSKEEIIKFLKLEIVTEFLKTQNGYK